MPEVIPAQAGILFGEFSVPGDARLRGHDGLRF
jgi:hypothetical protein